MRGQLQKLKRIIWINGRIKPNEDGFLLVVTLAMLLVLTIIGISATTFTRLELQIAGNDLMHKETFFQADGGAELAVALVEESYGTEGLGFTKLTTEGSGTVLTGTNKTVLVVDTTLSGNEAARTKSNVDDGARDIAYFPNGYNGALANPNVNPHTNIIVDGVTSLIPGEGSHMIAGYEGQGGGSASGKRTIHTIFAQHMGRMQSQSMVQIEWRHVHGLTIEGHY
jgi:hypothetical protein